MSTSNNKKFLELVKKLDNPIGKISDLKNFFSKTRVSQSALNEALFNAINSNMVLALLKFGADPNAVRERGITPIMACGHNKNKIKLLIEYGADVNRADDSGRTILDYVLGWNQPELSIFLLENGAIPTPYFMENIKNYPNYKPVLDYLAQKEAQRQMRQRLQIEQIQRAKSRKQGVLEQLRIIPRTQTLSGGRYLYPGGRTYLQAGKEFQEIGRSRGMNVQFKQDIEYPRGYQQFWRQYQGELGDGPSDDGSYNLRSPRKAKKYIRKSRKIRK